MATKPIIELIFEGEDITDKTAILALEEVVKKIYSVSRLKRNREDPIAVAMYKIDIAKINLLIAYAKRGDWGMVRVTMRDFEYFIREQEIPAPLWTFLENHKNKR